MEIIRSRQNARVKALRAAAANQGSAGDGLWLAEGWHLLEEAIRHDVKIEQIFVRDEAQERWKDFARDHGFRVEPAVLSADAFDSAVSTDSPQGVAALVRPRSYSIAEVLAAEAPVAVALAGVQDPGNVGTIVRSAVAFGAHAMYCLPGTANVFGVKALRASAGAAFALPIFSLSWPELKTVATSHGLVTVAMVPRNGVPPSQISWERGTLLLVGTEGAGLPDEIFQNAALRVTIPMQGTESLNAAVAASVLLYEASKQRRVR